VTARKTGADVPLVTVPGDPAAPAVALTFDDGPGPHTPQVLAVLAEHGVRATFFVCGEAAGRRPHVLHEIVRAGHLLGNHSLSHPQAVPGSVPFGHFDELPEDVQESQLDGAARAVERVLGTGAAPMRFFRGPGGRDHGALTGRLAARRGLAVVEWSADTEDWQAPAALDDAFVAGIVEAATVDAVAGTRRPIVLLHDAKASAEPESQLSSYRGNTVAALPRILEFHRRRGAAFVAPDGSPFP
jgi:peptidoglycan/xylan/chitin deacetylase (PgdA/CDA1 family)